MSAAGFTRDDVFAIADAAIQVKNVGTVLCKMGEAPGSVDCEVAAWLGELLLRAVAQLSLPHERLLAIVMDGQP